MLILKSILESKCVILKKNNIQNNFAIRRHQQGIFEPKIKSENLRMYWILRISAQSKTMRNLYYAVDGVFSVQAY